MFIYLFIYLSVYISLKSAYYAFILGCHDLGSIIGITIYNLSRGSLYHSFLHTKIKTVRVNQECREGMITFNSRD